MYHLLQPQTPATAAPATSAPARTISVDPECNKTKGCFMQCQDKDNCRFLVTWKPDGDYVEFEMAFRNYNAAPNRWIALGFSEDQMMVGIQYNAQYSIVFTTCHFSTNGVDAVSLHESLLNLNFQLRFSCLKYYSKSI